MKKILLWSIAMTCIFTACESIELDQNQQNQIAEKSLQTQSIEQTISKQASEILIKLLSNNPEYFQYLNESIVQEKDYLEDRVLFSDLFSNSKYTTKSAISRTIAKNNFMKDFKLYADKPNIYTRSKNNTDTLEQTTNVDSLINLLSYHNISIYCPFPLEDYSVDNRIPAICWIETENLDSLPGVQFHSDGTFNEVIVSQKYADNHPVWIIRKENDYIFDSTQKDCENLSKGVGIQLKDKHYEAIIENVYCTSYYGPIGEGDLRIYIGTNGNDPKFYEKRGSDSIFMGYISTHEIHAIPRKYVSWARKGYARGWYYFGQTIDPDWKTSEYEKYLVAYEDDNEKAISEVSHMVKFEYGKYKLTYNAIIKYNKSDRDDMIGIKELPRYYFFNIIKNGSDVTWTNSDKVTSNVDLDGNNLIKCGDLTMSIKCSTYYTEPQIVNPGEIIKPHPGNGDIIYKPALP